MLAKARIGAGAVIIDRALDEVIHTLLPGCTKRDLRRLKKLWDRHNQIVVTCVLIIMAMTSHRNVSDIVYRLLSIDLGKLNLGIPGIGLMLISDKRSTRSHDTRLIILNQWLVRLLKDYIKHLKYMINRLRRSHPELAGQIQSVLDAGEKAQVPLFCFYDPKHKQWLRVSRKNINHFMSRYLGQPWKHSPHTTRAFFETTMAELGCPTELIQIMMGHHSGGIHPMGQYSVLSTEAVARKLLPYLDQLSKRITRGNLSPFKHNKQCRTVPLLKNLKCQFFGPEKRDQVQQKTIRKIREEITGLMSEYATLDKKAVNDIIDRISRMDPDKNHLFLKRYTVLREELQKINREKKKNKVYVPPRYIKLRQQRCPYHRKTLMHARRLLIKQKRFIRYLEQQAERQEDPDPLRRQAEILLSMMLFGKLANHKLLYPLASQLHCFKRIHRHNTFIEVRPNESSSNIQRIVVDGQTRHLVAGLYKAYPNPPASDPARILKEMHFLINQVLRINTPEIRTLKDMPKGFVVITKKLRRLIKDHNAVMLPGMLSPWLAGEQKNAGISAKNLLRIVTGKVFKNDTDQLPPEEFFESYDHDQTTLCKSQDSTKPSIYWKPISRVIGVQKKSGPSKKDPSKEKDLRKTAQRNNLKQDLQDLEASGTLGQWDAPYAVTGFIKYLCEHGSQKEKKPALSTISNYASNVCSPFLDFVASANINQLNQSELHDIFTKIIYRPEIKKRAQTKQQLEYFYEYLRNAYDIPEVDWDDIVDDDLISPDHIDAGLVSRAEYLKALELLLHDPYLKHNHRQRRINAMILFLLFRFGLRPGEVSRLERRDLKWHKDGQLVIHVRNNLFGDLKTRNGIRKVPLVDPLTPMEYELADEWLGDTRKLMDDIRQTALFCQIGEPRLRINFGAASARVLQALRCVTNDNEVRLRHLRHTYASRLVMAVSLEHIPEGLCGDMYRSLNGDLDPNQVRELLTNQADLNSWALFAVADAMGHGSPGTTLKHYTHVMEFLLDHWLETHYTPFTKEHDVQTKKAA